MIPVDQDKFYVKDVSRGNCQQAAIASLLELKLSDVPNFIESEHGFWRSVEMFLYSKGFTSLKLSRHYNIDCFHLAYGKSSRGVSHAVIYRNGVLAHDPHFSREGIIEVDSVEILIPIDPAKFAGLSK